MIHFPRRARGLGPGRRRAAAGAGPLAWPCVSAAGALFSCPAGPPPRPDLLAVSRSESQARPLFPVRRGSARPPAVPGARAPRPPGCCAVPGIVTPGEPSWGQKSTPVPSGRSPPSSAAQSRLAAESPLPQEPAPISCPSPSLPSLILGTVQLAARRGLAQPGAPSPSLWLPQSSPCRPLSSGLGSFQGTPKSTCPDFAQVGPLLGLRQPSASHSVWLLLLEAVCPWAAVLSGHPGQSSPRCWITLLP